MTIVNDINYFNDKQNYVLSSHGLDDGMIFKIPNNIFIVTYSNLGEILYCSNCMPHLICNFLFKFDYKDKDGNIFKSAKIYNPGEIFPDLYLWPLKTEPNPINYSSGVEKCEYKGSNYNPSFIDIDKNYPHGIKLQEIVNFINLDTMIDTNEKIYIHVLACTTKGKQSVFAKAKGLNKKTRNKKTRNKKPRNKKPRNKKPRNKKTRKARKK
tara:strand:- start:1171 stop:1803 length:633 start_codon:yes stop_codon:yes gene_type:complete